MSRHPSFSTDDDCEGHDDTKPSSGRTQTAVKWVSFEEAPPSLVSSDSPTRHELPAQELAAGANETCKVGCHAALGSRSPCPRQPPGLNNNGRGPGCRLRSTAAQLGLF